jgi:hypothetical protein
MSMSRAERRRIARELGYKRSSGKKGRRSGHRASAAPAEARFAELERHGFVVARPKLQVPS